MSFREDAHIGKGRFDQIMGRSAPGRNWTRMDKKLLSWANHNYFYEDFVGLPTAQLSTGAAAAGATGDENYLSYGPNVFLYHMMGTQTIIIPYVTADGLNISLDQTENDGAEFTNGIALAAAKRVITVGTDPAVFFRVKFSIANVSGTDDCAVGWRKSEAFQANIDDYGDMAALNVISGNITMETIAGGAGTTSTDTTDDWDDGETHTLEVRVTQAGVVTYLIDGASPTVAAAFSFTAADVIVPFFYFLHASAPVAGAITLMEWEWGYLDN